MIFFSCGKPQGFHLTSISRFNSSQLTIRTCFAVGLFFIKEHKFGSFHVSVQSIDVCLRHRTDPVQPLIISKVFTDSVEIRLSFPQFFCFFNIIK